jgi:hypothetical protein
MRAFRAKRSTTHTSSLHRTPKFARENCMASGMSDAIVCEKNRSCSTSVRFAEDQMTNASPAHACTVVCVTTTDQRRLRGTVITTSAPRAVMARHADMREGVSVTA